MEMPDALRSLRGSCRFRIGILSAILLAFLTAHSQTSPAPPSPLNLHRWGSITLFNGLPSDAVRRITQTDDGYIWFGTDQGLARFDGRRIQVFRFDEPDSNQVLVLETDENNGLWVGTRNGAFRYEGQKFIPVGGTEGRAVTAILPGKTAFIGTANGSVLRLSAAEGGGFKSAEIYRSPVDKETQDAPPVTDLALFDERLIVATDGDGLVGLDPDSTRASAQTYGPKGVNGLFIESGKKLLIASNAKRTDSGLFESSGGNEVTLLAGQTGSVNSVRRDEDGGLWVGSRTNGLLYFKGPDAVEQYTFENTLGNLRSNNVYDVFIDREGVVWSGTDRGVSRFDPASPFHQVLSDNANTNFVRCLYRTPGGRVLAGTNLGLFERKGSEWTALPRFSKYTVYGILQEEEGDLLVATSEGLIGEDGKPLFEGDVRSVVRYKDRSYAAVFGSGLVEFSEDGQKLRVDEGSPTAAIVSGEKLWIGTAANGILSFDGTGAKTEIAPDLLKGGAVWDIDSDSNGDLWIGADQGLFVSRGGKVEQVASGVDVRDLLLGDGEVWAATSTDGLLHVKRDGQFGWLRSFINVEKGLPSDKTFAVLPEGDAMLIGTSRGLVTYKPDRKEPKISLVRALSQRLHSLRELVSGVELEYPQNTILIEVSGQSSRTFPEEFQYAFLLKDANGKILETRISGEPQYAPPGLEPGRYTIEARVFDRDLQSSPPFISKFSVGKEPFPWTATALGVLLVLAIGALIWAAVEHKRMRDRNRELAVARRDLVNEAERERRRIARDLHDQTLTDLRSLMMKSDRVSNGETWLRDEIEAVSTEIRRICEDLSPSVLENVGLVASLEFLLGQTVKRHSFSASTDADENIDLPMNFQLQVYRIAQEVLTNIDRHSDADFVEMKVEASENGRFGLTIRDNGSEFRPGEAEGNGRGIANIRSRANIISAKIGWEIPPEGGNLFTLEIGETEKPSEAGR
jgi:signal transduction histidine kinase